MQQKILSAKRATLVIVVLIFFWSAVFALHFFRRGGELSVYAADDSVSEPLKNVVETGGTYGDLSGKVSFDKPAPSSGSYSTFALIKDDVNVTSGQRSFDDYGKYINEYMPAGRYVLNLQKGTASTVLSFEIKKAEMPASLITYCDTLFKKFEVERTGDINYGDDNAEGDKISLKALLAARDKDYEENLGLGASDIPEAAGYWFEHSSAYFTARALTFAENIDDSADKDNVESFNKRQVYTCYYQITESNFQPLYESMRAFTVVPYDVITIDREYMEWKNGKWQLPEEKWPDWLGDKIAVLPTVMKADFPKGSFPSAKYHIARTSWTDGYDKCGIDHSVELTFAEPDFYRWNTSKDGTEKSCTTSQENKLTIYYRLKPAVNAWQDSPELRASEKENGVSLFDYESMNLSNIYSGVPKYGSVSEIKYSVTESEYGALPDKDSAVWKTAAETVEYVNGLPANKNKTYYLTVFSKGSTEYNEMSAVLKFAVLPRANSWLIEPVIPDFEYGSEISGITARPLFDGDGEFSAALSVTVNGKTYELSGAHNVWTDASFIRDLKALPARDAEYGASYKLVVSGNYTELTGSISFEVSKATNSWKEMPGITQWTYGDSTAIRITALPEISGDGGVLTAKLGGDTVEYTLSYVEDADGTYCQNADLTKALRGLDAGKRHALEITYSLDNYVDLTRTVGFYIEKAHNDWESTPTVDGWTWNGYEDAGNIYLNAKPHLHTSTGIITVTFGEKSEKFSFSEDHRYDLSVFADEFRSLTAGTYVLTVAYGESAESSNYGGITSAVGFNVWTASNRWDKAPSVANWQYGDVTSDNITFAKSAYGEIIKYEVDTENGTVRYESNGNRDDFIQSLKALPVRAYTMTVSVEGTSNYYFLSYSMEFEVTKKQRAWEEDRTDGEGKIIVSYIPSIGDMEYGNTCGISLPPDEAGVNVAVKYYDGDNKELDEAPHNRGTYKAVVEVSLADTVNYAGYTYNFEYEITPKQNGWKAEPESVMVLKLCELEKLPELELEFGMSTQDDAEMYGYAVTYSVSKAGAAARTANEGNRADIIGFIRANGAGTYTVTVTAISETRNGTKETATFSVVAEKNPNSWNKSENRYSVKYGTSVSEDLFVPASESDDILYFYNGTQYADIEEFIYNGGEWRNVAAYVLAVQADSRSNSWETVHGTLTLNVTYADNRWKSPVQIDGWTYGATASTPSAIPEYGEADDVTFTYEMWYGDKWVSVGSPTDAGKYRVYASLGSTANYNELVTERACEFEIAKAIGVVDPAQVSDWQWDAFDGAVNVFSAAVNSADETDFSGVRFTVRRQGMQDITFTGAPDAETEKKLNALSAGEYTLIAYVAPTANYTEAQNDEGSFKVSQARNSWTRTPFIISWSLYEFDSTKNLPEGIAVYGDTEFEIKNSAGKTVYEAVYRHDDAKLEQDTAHGYNLFDEPNGDYTLVATVRETNDYSGMTQSFPFIIFSGSTTRPANYWQEIPKIQDWIAEYGTSSEPSGKPLRWSKLTYSYFAAKWENNSYVADGDKIASYTVDVNYAVSDESGKIPSAPGYYILRISSVFDGYELDSMSHDTVFRIIKPQNEWTKTPSMQGYFAYNQPENPVEGIAAYDSRFTYSYRNVETGEVSEDPPTVKGKYVLTVTAIARVGDADSKYCDSIFAEIPFTVENGTNMWQSLPTISDWSEEFEPNEPSGLAEHGTIEYTYYDNAGNKLNEKPLTAGQYKLVATASADGYDTLTNESEFTITPAWDQTLLWVDIGLGLVACALTIVVIIFAVRRYKEN